MFCFTRGEISFPISRTNEVGELTLAIFPLAVFSRSVKISCFPSFSKIGQRCAVPRSLGIATSRVCRSSPFPSHVVRGSCCRWTLLVGADGRAGWCSTAAGGINGFALMFPSSAWLWRSHSTICPARRLTACAVALALHASILAIDGLSLPDLYMVPCSSGLVLDLRGALLSDLPLGRTRGCRLTLIQ